MRAKFCQLNQQLATHSQQLRLELGFVLILNFRESEQLKLGKMSRNLCQLFPVTNCAYSRDARSSILGSLTL